MSDSGDNRRRFFRIVDSVGVSYQILTETEAQTQQDNHSEDEPDTKPFVDTLSVMNTYNTIIQESLEEIKEKDEATATAIEQLNKKMDALLMMLELDSLITRNACHKVEEASLSASGIAFSVDEPLSPETCLALDLLLKPSAVHVNAIGKVISSETLTTESGDTAYYIRVDFTEINDADREKLIQHIVQRQGVLLRAMREEMDSQ